MSYSFTCDRKLIVGKICGGQLQRRPSVSRQVINLRCRSCGQEYSGLRDPDVVCAICADAVDESSTSMQPLGSGGAMVRVCQDCNGNHSRAGRTS